MFFQIENPVTQEAAVRRHAEKDGSEAQGCRLDGFDGEGVPVTDERRHAASACLEPDRLSGFQKGSDDGFTGVAHHEGRLTKGNGETYLIFFSVTPPFLW